VTIGKGKPQIARPEDALVMLRDALAAPSKSKLRQTLLEGALMAYYLGLLNQHKLNARGDRRGRPKGTTGVQHRHRSDDDALRLMAEIANTTGESKPYTLARLVVKNGHAPPTPNAERAIRRLAERWKVTHREIIK
jgi:hypothetical protein